MKTREQYCTHPNQEFCDCDWCRLIWQEEKEKAETKLKGEQMNTEKVKAGKQKDGRYFFDCGCWINTLIQYRCPLHSSAPELLEACKAIQKADVLLFDVQVPEYRKAIHLIEQAIAKAEGRE